MRNKEILNSVKELYSSEVKERYSHPFKDVSKLEDGILFILKGRYEFICRNKYAFIIINCYLTNEDIRKRVITILKEFVSSIGEVIFNKFSKFDEFDDANLIEDIIRLIASQIISYFIQTNFIEAVSADKKEQQLKK